MLEYNQNKIKSAKIMIVEDNETSLQALSIILSAQNYQILPVTSGIEALQIVEDEKLTDSRRDLALVDTSSSG